MFLAPPAIRFGGRARLRARLALRVLAWRLLVKGAHRAKRVLDVVGAAIALVLASPVFLIAAIAIKLEDRGPIIFRQTRVGRWGREFEFYKFRSMVPDAELRKLELLRRNESADGVIFKMRGDPRITWVGRVLRRTSLDELPQLWNVLGGEMSLVGPRPPLPSEVAVYALDDLRRLSVKPGITCIWQVSGRSTLPFREQVRLDVDYIESHSLALDASLILRTVPAVLFGKGAY